MARFFADSNILIYATELEGRKVAPASRIVLEGPVISVQVLNEFVNVSMRKRKMPIEVVSLALAPIRLASEIVPITVETHELALTITRKYKFPIFDANIVAAAELAGCDVLYTEDMSHGQIVGRVRIVNPFLAT